MDLPIDLKQRVFSDSIGECLEVRVKGSRFPVLQGFLKSDIDDLPYESVKKLREELLVVRNESEYLRIGTYCKSSILFPNDTDLIVPGFVHVEYFFEFCWIPSFFGEDEFVMSIVSPRETFESFINSTLEVCDIALECGCGFGSYSM